VKSSLIRGSALALAIVSTGLAIPAHAGEAGSAEIVAAGAKAGVEATASDDAGATEILVTARRRAESAQNVPIALTALGGESLEAKGAFHIQQIYQEVPSLTVFTVNPRNVNINIRGLGSNVAIANNGLDLGVGFYVDDVYYARVGQAGFDLVDVAQVEILRGPQGTLFGRNTTAGAITVTTREPTFDTEASGDVSLGDYGFFQGRGTISGPIVADKLAARLSVEATNRDGFIDDVYQKRSVHDFNNYTVRGSLLWHISPDASLKLSADYARQRQSCCVGMFLGVLTQYDNGAPVVDTWYQRNARLGYQPLPFDPKARETDSDWLGPIRMTTGGGSARLKWDLGGAELTSISAFRWWNWTPRNDADYSALNIHLEGNQYDRQRQFSQEIRIASTGNRKIDYVAGLYAFHQSIRGWFVNEYGRDAGNYLVPTGTLGLNKEQIAAALNGAYTYAPSKPQTASFAAFGQLTWHLSEALSVTGGLRFTRERKYGHFEQQRGNRYDTSGLNAAQIALRNSYTPLVPYYELSRWWNSFSGLLTVSGQITPDVLAYATYSRGAKSGGLNFASLPSDASGTIRTDLAEVAPERVDNYELGLKTQWFDKRLTVNLAAFLINVADYQSTVYDVSFVPARSYIANIGKVRSKGAELDVRTRPFDGLSLYGSATYNDAKYIDYPDAQCPFEQRAPGLPAVCDLGGKKLPGAPKWAYALGGEVSREVSGNGNQVYAAVDYSHRSSYNSSYNLSRFAKIDAFGLANARAGIRGPTGTWDFYVWGRNIFDKLYYNTSSVNDTGGVITGILGDPRTYGATFRHKF
jgi:iron complex outermembrane receptor protein